jgi:hypothetical protein
MGDKSEVPDHNKSDPDNSNSSSKLGDLPAFDSHRDRVPELPNIGRNSTASRASIGERGPGTPLGQPPYEGVANGGEPPQLAKVGYLTSIRKAVLPDL